MITKRFTTLALLAIVAVFSAVLVGSARADVTGASASKDCPGNTAELGQVIHCTFTAENTGQQSGTITQLTEQSPSPGGALTNISCTAGGVVYHTGDTLPQGIVCSGTFDVTIPNDPTLCGTTLQDRVEIDLLYPQFSPPLTAGAFATNTTLIVCPPHIQVTKTADTIGKIGDPVTYTVAIKNTGNSTLTKTSVMDTLKGDITTLFPATIAAGATQTVTYTRTVQAGDPDPLVNTVTAVYSNGTTSDTESASATTNLFQPSVSVTKNCVPKPVLVGGTITCSIVIRDTSSNDSPALNAASITDTRSGDLRASGNTNVVSSDCVASLTSGGSCTIVTRESVTAADLPGPVVDTVAVDYHPAGFPNDVRGSASDNVPINFAPAYTLTKSCGPSPENVGDTTTYTFVITNTGNAALTRTSVSDTLLGSLTSDFPAALAPGDSVTVHETRVVLAGDPSPLPNTVTSVYSAVDGTAISHTANCSIVIVHPSMTLTKACAPANENIGDTTTYTFVVTNTGDVGLTRMSVTDTLLGTLTSQFPANLAPGQSVTVTATRTVLATDPSPLPNTVTTVYGENGFTVTITKTANCSITINPPPGTVKVTIGFWKTHAPASCKQGNGNQADLLTKALGSGIQLGASYKLIDACKAVQLLSKNNINGVAEPGDPIFNFLAQMVGAELNIGNGGTTSGSCSFINGAITDANTLLTAIHFNGVTYDKPLTAAQKAQADSLNTLFGNYNNDSATC